MYRFATLITITALCATGWFAISSPATAFVPKPADLRGVVTADVQFIAQKYYARKAAASKAAYKAQTKRYQLRRDTHKFEAKQALKKKERAETRRRVGRGIGY